MSNFRPERWVLLEYGFRPFFLGAGLFAIAAVAAWLVLLHGGWSNGPANPVLWHGHEMLFGFVGAALAGFLLTAIPNWTGRVPVKGRELAMLGATWLVGRLAMALSGGLPPGMVAVLDLAFLVALMLIVVREVRAGGNRRHYPIVAVVSLLVFANGLTHLQALWPDAGTGMTGIKLGIHVMLLLITIIGGRIVPAFTNNWLRQRQSERLPVSRAWIERLAIGSTILVGLADTVSPAWMVTGLLALIAAVAHGLRLAGWRGRHTLPEPLLAVLHLGYGWLVIGYALLGLSVFVDDLPRSSALHALTIGAMGTMILAVMSRAALGHTGRTLHASRVITTAYALVTVAALLRVGAVLAPTYYFSLIGASGLAWAAAFSLFVAEYWPILTRPRRSTPVTSPASPS